MATSEKLAPATPAGPAPRRRPASIRRTSSLDADWPQGRGMPTRVQGRARDLFTPPQGEPQVLGEDWLEVIASPTREITAITANRRNDEVRKLIGARGGGGLRSEIARLLPQEKAGTTPLHLLLDDFPGTSLVAGWAWSRWTPDWKERMIREHTHRMEGICSGFRTGASSLFPDGRHDPRSQTSTPVPPLEHPDDPGGWHDLPVQDGVGLRRARRIDVWFDDLIQMDIGFQDSATSPGGGRIGQHEYRVLASADPITLRLTSIAVDPRLLPYPECRGAAPNAVRLEGAELAAFRLEVLARLPGELGCTHLNDVLRTMADVPGLARRLQAELRRRAPAA